jgi:DNA-binding transcriptional LysR family regulator
MTVVELRHLRALVALEESDTFTTAAAVLGTTQPTLSRTIAQLEQIVAVRLVERNTREASFTPAGRRLAGEARGLLVRLDNVLADLHDDSGRPLRLGWAWIGLGAHTVPLLKGWRESHGTSIELVRPDNIEAALARGDLDAAIIRRSPPPTESSPGQDCLTLFSESLIAAVAASNSLNSKAALNLSDLAPGPIVVCSTAPTATASLWEHTGRSPRTISVSDTDEWLTRIAIGDAVGVTAAATTKSHQHPDVAYLPIQDSPPVDVAMVWPAINPHPQVTAFANFARDYFAQVINTGTPPMLLSLP